MGIIFLFPTLSKTVGTSLQGLSLITYLYRALQNGIAISPRLLYYKECKRKILHIRRIILYQIHPGEEISLPVCFLCGPSLTLPWYNTLAYCSQQKMEAAEGNCFECVFVHADMMPMKACGLRAWNPSDRCSMAMSIYGLLYLECLL